MTRLLIGASILGVLLMAPSGAFAEDCLDRLGTNTYTCDFKSSIGTESTSTLQFFGAVSGNATWSGFTGVSFVTCACGTDGSFKLPKFKHSKTKWQCLGANTPPIGDIEGLVIEGSVGAGGKITKVNAQSYINDAGLVVDRTTYVLSCVKN